MPQDSKETDIIFDSKIDFLVGNKKILEEAREVPSRICFDEEIVDFLNALSVSFMKDPKCRNYPDIVTLGFWLRKASIVDLKSRFEKKQVRLGKGAAFHIAPSNVPVNFAYSLFSGLLAGNANIVRISEKSFEQVEIIVRIIKKHLDEYNSLRPYICIIRYERGNKMITDHISKLADVRIVWGGDNTISSIRKSELNPRATEITFANRFSLALIDSDAYMQMVEDGKADKVAADFYNDTYLTDQNACTSPRIVVWIGKRTDEAKEEFWTKIQRRVFEKYHFQEITAINKLACSACISSLLPGCKMRIIGDNRLFVVSLPDITTDILKINESAGFFYEYSCEDIMELRPLCDDRQTQTISFIGNPNMLTPLLCSGIHGVDRIVPIGKTMNFDLIWDGYNLIEQMTRTISATNG